MIVNGNFTLEWLGGACVGSFGTHQLIHLLPILVQEYFIGKHVGLINHVPISIFYLFPNIRKVLVIFLQPLHPCHPYFEMTLFSWRSTGAKLMSTIPFPALRHICVLCSSMRLGMLLSYFTITSKVAR